MRRTYLATLSDFLTRWNTRLSGLLSIRGGNNDCAILLSGIMAGRFVFRCMMLIVGTPSIVFISPYYILSFPMVRPAWDNWWIFSKPLFRKWWFRKWKWWICQNRSHIPFRVVCIKYFICNLIFSLHLFSSYVSFCHNRIVLLQQNWQ